MMLVQTCGSPIFRMWCATRPCGLRTRFGNDIGVQEIAHQRSTGLGGRSAIGGKSSSRVRKVASTASSDLGGVGSTISRSPSLRIMASSPGSSNSRGILTAWFLPFLKSFTCRSGAISTSLAYAKAYYESGQIIELKETKDEKVPNRSAE